MDKEYGHIQSDLIGGIVEEALNLDGLEREELLGSLRAHVVHAVAILIDDAAFHAEDDPLVMGLSTGRMPVDYPQNEMIRAGLDVVAAYDRKDFDALGARLHTTGRTQRGATQDHSAGECLAG